MKMPGKIGVGIVVVAIAAYGIIVVKLNGDHPITTPVVQNAGKNPTAKKHVITLSATGDMLPHDSVNMAAKQVDGTYDYVPLFGDLPQFMKSDIVFCNQESPTAPGLSVSGYPTFNAPEQFATSLSSIGCNLISLGNNHSNDRGQAGISQTRVVWDDLPKLAVSGTARSVQEQQEQTVFTIQGVRFAFLAYTICSNNRETTDYGVTRLERSVADRQIDQAQAKADMVIVSTHWCRENTHNQDSQQDQWAQYFADKNVDLVIGTGPHWLQPVKQLSNKKGGKTTVWFSLGNFLNSQLEKEGRIGGVALMDIDPDTYSIGNLRFLPTYMHYEWTSEQKARQDLLARTNLRIYRLSEAAEPLSRSLLGTTVSQEQQLVRDIMNKYTTVTIID